MERKDEWFSVSREGLRNTIARKGVAFVGYELVQNTWDENITRVDVTLSEPSQRIAQLTVEDDSPEGFRDLTHAYTMFAHSYKRADAEKRGAFNIGEKLVLALCEEASIATTKGTVNFNKDGSRTTASKKTRAKGTRFSARIRLSNTEYVEFVEGMQKLLPPKPTFFNGKEIPVRQPVHEFELVLPTVIADEEGQLRRTNRKAKVRLYEPLKDEQPMLYEMGIPVVELGDDRWHVEVMQKVPVNIERDNVAPAYLRMLRVAVLNAMAQTLTKAEATANWVTEAAGDGNAEPTAVSAVLDQRFGEKRVTWDPSDLPANERAAAEGYTVVKPGFLPKGVFDNIRANKLQQPAGRVTPSFTPGSSSEPQHAMIERNRWTPGMQKFEAYAKWFGDILHVQFTKDVGETRASFSGSILTVNKVACGNDFFEGELPARLERWTELLIRELGAKESSLVCGLRIDKIVARLAGKLARKMHETPYEELEEKTA